MYRKVAGRKIAERTDTKEKASEENPKAP